jgi:nitrite reductase/ring-hydroxylating ferredoxin subunit
MARLDRQLYAYADECPRCGTALTAGTVAGTTLSCSGCAGRYDLHLAGRSVDGGAERLRPLPLLDDVAGIRVALEPEAV